MPCWGVLRLCILMCPPFSSVSALRTSVTTPAALSRAASQPSKSEQSSRMPKGKKAKAAASAQVLSGKRGLWWGHSLLPCHVSSGHTPVTSLLPAPWHCHTGQEPSSQIPWCCPEERAGSPKASGSPCPPSLPECGFVFWI
jgi:hypothetical protein